VVALITDVVDSVTFCSVVSDWITFAVILIDSVTLCSVVVDS